jgi:hypothetical protein
VVQCRTCDNDAFLNKYVHFYDGGMEFTTLEATSEGRCRT